MLLLIFSFPASSNTVCTPSVINLFQPESSMLRGEGFELPNIICFHIRKINKGILDFYYLETRDLMRRWLVSSNLIGYCRFTATLVSSILIRKTWEKIFDWSIIIHLLLWLLLGLGLFNFFQWK